jgi:Mg-chelatase subunit ChlD
MLSGRIGFVYSSRVQSKAALATLVQWTCVVALGAGCSAGTSSGAASDAGLAKNDAGGQTVGDASMVFEDASSVDAAPTCIRSSVTSSVRPLDLSIVVDNSGSLATPPRVQTRNAYISAITSHPSLVGATARFHAFPKSNLCDAPAYAASLLTAPLPSPAIEPLLATLAPQGSSVLLQGLSGAYLALSDGQMQSTNASAVVLVNDGLPAGCGSTVPAAQAWSQIRMAASEARKKNIKTYIVQLVADPTDASEANTVAMAGGSGTARVVADVASVALDVPLLAQALNDDRGGISCIQQVPADFSDAGDAAQVQHLGVYATANGKRQKVPFDAACGGAEGWTLSPGGKNVVLCARLCAALAPDKNAIFEVGVDCLFDSCGLDGDRPRKFLVT